MLTDMYNIVEDNVLKNKVPFQSPDADGDPVIHQLLTNAEANIDKYLRWRRKNPGIWLVNAVTGDSVPFSSVGPMSRRAANVLTDLGFQRGDILHFACYSSLDFFWPLLGAWLCGGSTSIGNPAVSTEVIKIQLEDTKAKILVCSKEYVDKFASVIENGQYDTRLLVLNSNPEDILPAGTLSFKLLMENAPDTFCCEDTPPYKFEDSTLIFWTRDSSGHPMGVVRTLEFPEKYWPEKYVVLISSFSTDVGICISLHKGLCKGQKIVFIPEGKFDGKSCLDYIVKYQATNLYLTTEHSIKLSQEVPVTESDENRFELYFMSPLGNALNNAIAKKLLRLLHCKEQVISFEFYDKKEFGIVADKLSMCKLGNEYVFPSKYKMSICNNVYVLGDLSRGSQVYIADIKTGEKLGPGEIGRIMAKTKYMMLKYLNRPSQTELFLDEDGFANTGDIGYYNTDGLLFLCGSDEDVMLVDGCWFGPVAIEYVLENVKEIGEAQVWGERDSSTGNDIVHARVSFCKWAEPWTKEKIREYANSRLPPSQHITGNIFVMDNLPHTLEGEKVRRDRSEDLL